MIERWKNEMSISSEQLADLLVGIARAQAAAITAIAETLESSPVPRLVPAVGKKLFAELGKTDARTKAPITLATLPSKLLAAAVAPTSKDGQDISNIAVSEVSRLLGG